MITRGIYIGKIVDDFALLKGQIELRNKMGQYELSKFCEDFFKEVLNITYKYNLINLNKTRNNNPGLDLGDENIGVAYQITSMNTKAKIEHTYKTITDEQKKLFKNSSVLIIGNKLSSYPISEAFCKLHNFEVAKNIIDINSLLRDIVLLDIDQLEILYSLFSKEFRQVRIELEPLDSEGNFESSYYNTIEKKPSTLPKNGVKFLGPIDKDYPKEYGKLLQLYENLASVPRLTRELLSIIVERGKYEPTHQLPNRFGIIPESLAKILRININELLTEVNILEDSNLAEFGQGDVGERIVNYLVIKTAMLNDLFNWMKENELNIRTLLNSLDFSILDE